MENVVRKFIKYENRKLHEVGDRTPYQSMEKLLELVASGIEIEVADDVTGRDITGLVLSRLVYDRCRSDPLAYKRSELTKLIRSSPPPEKQEASAR